MSNPNEVTKARQAWMETTTALMASGTDENRAAEAAAWANLQTAVTAYASENGHAEEV